MFVVRVRIWGVLEAQEKVGGVDTSRLGGVKRHELACRFQYGKDIRKAWSKWYCALEAGLGSKMEVVRKTLVRRVVDG